MKRVERDPVEIALVIYTKDDPINLDTLRLERLLADYGYTAHLLEVDWTIPREWEMLTDPGRAGVSTARHNVHNIDSDVVVMMRHPGEFIRLYEDDERDTEIIHARA